MPYKSISTVLFAVTGFLLFSCANPVKLLEKGQFDDAIYLSVKKLSGKKKKKVKYVQALENAVARATYADMRHIETLQKEGRKENWVEINDIHRRIRNRQEAIEPLLPLIAENGIKANFRFVKIEDLEIESKKKAAEFYYLEGKRKLALAENGDKIAAREAYDEFENIGRYYKEYRDEKSLMAKAVELGTVYVLFKMENQSNVILPRDFERELKKMSVRDLDKAWRTVHLNLESGLDYDYTVIMRLREIDTSPNLIKEREYVDDKTIEDGWEYVLDSNGNVMKDSSGNDIKIPKKVLIKARVFESYQHKAAHVGGDLEFFDNRTKELIHSEYMAVDAVFENFAATFDGDKRALTEESKKKIGNKPVPFPSSESMLFQAASLLKPKIKEKIYRSRLLL
jgi:hypothetical protein